VGTKSWIALSLSSTSSAAQWLARGHLSVGQDDLARDHLDRGRASVEALGNDDYGQMIKDGLDRLADRLA